MKKITFCNAITEALDEEIARDKNVYILGEDMEEGGGFGQATGLFKKYGAARVKNTPISETAILGTSIGASALGLRPVPEIMFNNFMTVCWDELYNQLSKLRYMTGGQLTLPVTVRTVLGAGMSAAEHHSSSMEGMFISMPGLKVVYPSNVYDAKGLLKAAIRDDNPVLFLENMALILDESTSEVPEEDYTVPIGKADVKREGSNVTVVATGLMVHRALAAAETLQQKGISIEVVDPRTLVPLDKKTILDSVKKTGRLVVMTEETITGSVAGEIAAIVAEEAFDSLDAPIKRVCAPDTSVPFAPVLEKFFVPDEDNLIKAVTEIM